ncbi:T9SS type A sorting domain-containing protein [Candidatus Marinimicrobia bacterium]|nr:T9SS type A sorting domain-containing protein [Candidatus Neomarinimicrobiota bacterium]
MKKYFSILIPIIFLSGLYSQCDSAYTHYSELPSNVTILVGDSCLFDEDITVLDSIISQNELVYESPLELGTQTWFNGRLRFMVAGNYGNSSGVNDTIYILPENMGNWTGLASLYLEWNRISVLPESFSEMVGLQSFYINNNVLTSLGENFGNLENLYFLDLGYNKLDSIPESICNLSNLSYFWLFNNNLASLPDCFCDINLDWNNDDNGGYPYFAIGANMLCDSVETCVAESEHFELSLDQFYYSFPVYAPQDCDSVSISESPFPYQFKISQPYPNPFNPRININLYIPFKRKMDIHVFDLLGNEVDIISNGKIYKSGTHTIQWDGRNFPSGVYFIKINDGMNILIQKMVLAK